MITKPVHLYTALLDTPTIFSSAVRAISLPFWDASCSWPELTYTLYGGIPKRAYCYIGRTGNGLLKIGISETPLDRMLSQELGPLLVILDCQPVHEKALHYIFRSELVRHREMFSGPRVEAFVDAARRRAAHPFRSYRPSRDFQVKELNFTDPPAANQLKAQHAELVASEKSERAVRYFRRKSRIWFLLQEQGKAAA